MKVSTVKFNHANGDYPVVNGKRQTAHITLKYRNKICMTSVLPTTLPDTLRKTTLQLDTQGALGNCWNMDVSSGEETMVMELKLPFSSPIAVSKVKIIDDSDPRRRCWTSNWRSGSNYNRQTNQWVAGTFFVSNNFDGNCT